MYHVDQNGNKLEIQENFAYNAVDNVIVDDEDNKTRTVSEKHAGALQNFLTTWGAPLIGLILIIMVIAYVWKKMGRRGMIRESFGMAKPARSFGFKFY